MNYVRTNESYQEIKELIRTNEFNEFQDKFNDLIYFIQDDCLYACSMHEINTTRPIVSFNMNDGTMDIIDVDMYFELSNIVQSYYLENE